MGFGTTKLVGLSYDRQDAIVKGLSGRPRTMKGDSAVAAGLAVRDSGGLLAPPKRKK